MKDGLKMSFVNFMSVLKRLENLFLNVFAFVYGKMIGRTRRCVLFGAWMGKKFADNSRYLYQYLHEHKEKLGIDHVIWATRNPMVYNMLKGMNYECVLIGTTDARYWHCKCGIHFLCDAQFDTNDFPGDIDSSFSAGAKKVQLWHGNGIKCVPGGGGGQSSFIRTLRNLTTQGGWYVGNYRFLCKSDMDFHFFKEKFGASKKVCIDSAYPRTCECLRHIPGEMEIMKQISEFKKCIAYLPTFRKDYQNYIHPLSDPSIVEFLEKNNCLWIEKPHAADKHGHTIIRGLKSNHVLILDSTFDINVLLRQISLLITDYSSVMLDALFYRKPVLYYVPDYDYYIKNDRGFLIDYDSVCITQKVFDTKELLEMIKKTIVSFSYDDKMERMRKQFWKHDDWSYPEIWNSICETLYPKD